MVKHYTCPTCGYDNASWVLRINTSRMQLCENCYPQYVNRHSRIIGFKLNQVERKKVQWR